MDELLLKKAQQGDPQAFESLMSDLESLVWRVCWHYTGDRENASDCGQEAMIRIWRNLGTFRFECSFETWVYRICANCSLDFLRRSGKRTALPLEALAEEGYDPPDPSPGVEERAIQNDEHARLREAIRQLPEEQRDALVLTQLEGHSYQDAARLLETSEGTVKSRVNRARARLKQLFSGGAELSSASGVQTDEPPSRTHKAPDAENERRDRYE